MNTIILCGRLTKDPSYATTQGGQNYAKFSLAVDRVGQEKTDFIDCTAWGKTAELVNRYLVKGRQVIVQGSLYIDTYERDGVKRTKADVRVDRVEFVGSKENTAQNANNGADGDINRLKPIDDEDIPF